MKFQEPRLLSDKELNIIRGKAMVGGASFEEIQQIFGHIDVLGMKLNECDYEDVFGTEGWRHYFGYPE